MEGTIKCVTALIHSALTGEKVDFPGGLDDDYSKVIRLARGHEVAHLTAFAMLNCGLLKDEENIKSAQKLVYDASYKDTKNRHAYELAVKALNDAQIPFVPLKGVIIKEYYPESWMRSSCDVDILVHKKNFKRAFAMFKNMGFTLDGDLNFHDVSLIYDDSNLELHFSICENIKNIDSVLKDVWDYTVKAEGYQYFENNDYFMFHHIAHMSYHFLAGGCGIRPFVDFWLLSKKNFFDESAVLELCKKAKIYDFYINVKHLTEVWFEGAEHSETSKRLENYILTGGAYGCFPNNAAAYTVRNGGKLKFLLSLAFPPYRNMKVIYPILNRVPVLLPLVYAYRIFQKTVSRNSGLAKQRYEVIRSQDKEFIKEVASLIKALKLDK
ncbi:MAG: nucleotidyltransferase family protein [Clostridia bacterium]|nr:nucleotidyltransferase family protein [Clostridia bacterium]